ncbi:MAG: methylenetetrahydrofolate reductase [NAD(P)H] [Fimbriimonadaceae bacterium]|nr:methylenetetrahydrofolate reductase [NAD(P)H] [Fimbriimonadaceae bacterium]QYK54975.1 MAG: methylenetetrahydrofolate reductase [NAD(P)H] [Fimbriimonadaceae bacterium]
MRVCEVYRRPVPAFSFEFFPPKTEAGLERLYSRIAHLGELNPAFVSVTYGAGGSTRGKTVETARHIQNAIGIDTMAHLTCRGQDAAEVAAILDELAASGVQNVLALRGDAPIGEVGPTKGDFRYASDLISFIARRGGFCIGAACYPEGHIESPSREDDLAWTAEKVEAGADFLITQVFFDNAVYFDFVARARASGISVPIVPGLMPMTHVAQIERFTKMCGASIPAALSDRLEGYRDDEQATMAIGIEWALRQSRELLAGGAPGIHFYTLNRSLATRVVCMSLMG